LNIQQIKEKLFPENLRLIDLLLYVFTVGVLSAIGIPKMLDLNKSWMIALLACTVIVVAVFSLLVFRNPQRLLQGQRRLLLTLHFLVAAIILAAIVASILQTTWKHIGMALWAISWIYATLYGVTRLLSWLGLLGKEKIQRLVSDRRSAAEETFFASMGFEVLSLMRPKRRFLYLAGNAVMIAGVLYSGLALLFNRMYLEAGILVATVLLGESIIEFVFNAEVIERKSVEGELQVAHRLQMSLMPTSDPSVEGFDISGICHPAEEVGGDFYDYVWLDELHNQLGIALADVSGKAMKAAMTAVMTSGMVYREVEGGSTPKEILTGINKPMYLKTQRNSFTAMLMAVLNVKERTVTLSNAGQTHPLLLRNGMISELRPSGSHLPLGVMHKTSYEEETLPLYQGDVVLFFTDGLTESMNVHHEMFGYERLQESLKKCSPGGTARGLLLELFGTMLLYSGKAKQHDDMTAVAVKVL
jgi:hypothetical protein